MTDDEFAVTLLDTIMALIAKWYGLMAWTFPVLVG